MQKLKKKIKTILTGFGINTISLAIIIVHILFISYSIKGWKIALTADRLENTLLFSKTIDDFYSDYLIQLTPTLNNGHNKDLVKLFFYLREDNLVRIDKALAKELRRRKNSLKQKFTLEQKENSLSAKNHPLTKVETKKKNSKSQKNQIKTSNAKNPKSKSKLEEEEKKQNQENIEKDLEKLIEEDSVIKNSTSLIRLIEDNILNEKDRNKKNKTIKISDTEPKIHSEYIKLKKLISSWIKIKLADEIYKSSSVIEFHSYNLTKDILERMGVKCPIAKHPNTASLY